MFKKLIIILTLCAFLAACTENTAVPEAGAPADAGAPEIPAGAPLPVENAIDPSVQDADEPVVIITPSPSVATSPPPTEADAPPSTPPAETTVTVTSSPPAPVLSEPPISQSEPPVSPSEPPVSPSEPDLSPLSPERELQILENSLASTWRGALMTAEDLEIMYYFGTFNGCEAVVIFPKQNMMTADMQYIEIAGHTIALGSGSLQLVVHDNGRFVPIRDAYEQGLISEKDIEIIAGQTYR